MPSDLSVLSAENPAFSGFMFYSSILVVKMMFMSVYTGRQRMKFKAFANAEDSARLKIQPKTNDVVERVRRAHLNDLENIPIFIVAAFTYLFTNPSASTALLLFRTFTAARIMHTLVYAVVVVPQPARALSFFAGFLITGYMAFKTAMEFF